MAAKEFLGIVLLIDLADCLFREFFHSGAGAFAFQLFDFDDGAEMVFVLRGNQDIAAAVSDVHFALNQTVFKKEARLKTKQTISTNIHLIYFLMLFYSQK